MRYSRPALTLAALACAAALGLAACGGDDETSTAAETTGSTSAVASEPDLDRYCELVTELDQRSAEIFSALSPTGEVPTDEELAAAQQQVFDENADLIDELSRAAPEEIAEDFELTLDSARERAAAGDAGQPSKEVAEAGVRLRDFRRDNCPGPGSS